MAARGTGTKHIMKATRDLLKVTKGMFFNGTVIFSQPERADFSATDHKTEDRKPNKRAETAPGIFSRI